MKDGCTQSTLIRGFMIVEKKKVWSALTGVEREQEVFIMGWNLIPERGDLKT